MRPLLPTLKEKKRYVVYETTTKVSHKHLIKTIEQTLGIFESAKAGLQHIKAQGNKGIIRVRHDYADKLRAAFTLVEEIEGTRVRVRARGVSGILNKAQRFM